MTYTNDAQTDVTDAVKMHSDQNRAEYHAAAGADMALLRKTECPDCGTLARDCYWAAWRCDTCADRLSRGVGQTYSNGDRKIYVPGVNFDYM